LQIRGNEENQGAADCRKVRKATLKPEKTERKNGRNFEGGTRRHSLLKNRRKKKSNRLGKNRPAILGKEKKKKKKETKGTCELPVERKSESADPKGG